MPNITLSKSLRAGVSVSLVTAALMMGACGKKDKGGAPVISAEKAPLALSGLSAKDFARHFAVPTRKTDETEAQNALAALGLTESNTNGLSWDTQKGSGGNYVFTNMKRTDGEDLITIDKAQIFGVHMENGEPTFDRADFGNVTIKSDEAAIKVAAMSLARPTADTAKAIVQSLAEIDTGKSLDFGDNAKFGFGALSMKSVDIKADEVTGNIGQLVWGTDETTKRSDLKIENVDFNIPQKGSDVAALLTLKGLSGRGLNTAVFSDSLKASGGAPRLSSLMSGFSSNEKPYDSFKLEALKFDSDAVNLDLPKIEGEAKTKGDITKITQVMAPTTIQMKDNVSGSARQAYEVIQQLGFDKMTFNSSQTTILDKGEDTMEVKDGILDMSDGFRLNYTYKASGLSALEAADTDQAEQLANTLENVKVNGMTLSLEDKSIVERGLKLAAQMRGADVGKLKREMRAALTIAPLVARNDLEKDIAGQLGDAFMDFVDDGGTLTIQFAPKEPLALSALENLDTLSSKDIGFSARQDK